MHPRRRPMATVALAAGLVVATLLGGCSAEPGGGAGQPRPSDRPGTPAATADTDPADAASGGDPAGTGGAGAGLGSGRPELADRVALAVTTGREVFVRPSCTPDATGQRLCWNESALPYELDPGAAAVVASAARTDLDAASDAWFVDLVLAEAPSGSLAAAADRADGDTRLALTTPGGDLLALAPPGASVAGDRVRLAGFDKAAAYDLVAALVELADDQAREASGRL